MLGLQVGRVLGYAIVFPTSLVGALFCIAHGLSKWIPYVVYRFGGERRHVPNHLNCLLIFGLCALGLAVAGQGNALWNVQGLLIIGYLGARASRDIWRMRADLLPLPGRSSSS